jgi:hypothetical protein
MPALFDFLYREYCRTRLTEMRKQRLFVDSREAPETNCDADHAHGAADRGGEPTFFADVECRDITSVALLRQSSFKPKWDRRPPTPEVVEATIRPSNHPRRMPSARKDNCPSRHLSGNPERPRPDRIASAISNIRRVVRSGLRGRDRNCFSTGRGGGRLRCHGMLGEIALDRKAVRRRLRKPYLHRARSQALLYFVVPACPLLGSQEAGRMTRMGRVSTEV